MDESDLVKTGMEVVLKPITDIAENALGIMGGDWLSEKRARNRGKLKARTEKILKDRGAALDDDPSPSIVTPLLSAAQDEGRDELLDLWAKLLASAMDPKRRNAYRREFVDIVKKLEPIDILILPLLSGENNLSPSRIEYVAGHLGISNDMVGLSFRNLQNLELITDNTLASRMIFPLATPLGRQLLTVVSD